MRRRRARWATALFLASLAAAVGCGKGESTAPAMARDPAARPLQFVGFDASEPIIAAIRSGKMAGTVAQNPLKIGELGIKTAVAALRKEKVQEVVATGEVSITRQTLGDPDVLPLLNPAKVDTTADAGAASAGGKKAWTIMVIPKGTTHVFWQTVHAGARKAAEEAGDVAMIWQAPQKEDDRTVQIQLVESATAARVDAIVLAPLDAKALVGAVERAVARGIVVVIIDSGLASTKPVSTVATDNYHGGVLAAQMLGKAMDGRGRLLLMRYMVGSRSTEERERGFTDTLGKEFPAITYLSQDQYGGATPDSAQKVAESLVTRYRGQIDGVFCPNESSTIGMMRALERGGLLVATPEPKP